MEIQLWRSILCPYELAVKELTVKFEHMIEEYRENDRYSPIEQVSGRVKSVSSILEIYAAIMIGQLFNKHRTLAAVIAYIVIQTILGTLASIFYLLNPASFLIGAGDGILGYGDIWRSVVEYTGLAVIFFFITDYLMRRRLNLE